MILRLLGHGRCWMCAAANKWSPMSDIWHGCKFVGEIYNPLTFLSQRWGALAGSRADFLCKPALFWLHYLNAATVWILINNHHQIYLLLLARNWFHRATDSQQTLLPCVLSSSSACEWLSPGTTSQMRLFFCSSVECGTSSCFPVWKITSQMAAAVPLWVCTVASISEGGNMWPRQMRK